MSALADKIERLLIPDGRPVFPETRELLERIISDERFKEKDQAMKILTIRQPWAWLIVNGYKDVENRTWKTPVRGPILIHASQRMIRQEYLDAKDFVLAVTGRSKILFPWYGGFDLGGIVGQATIVDCVSSSDSQWFTGPFGFVLKDAKPLPFRPMKGALGFWREKGWPL